MAGGLDSVIHSTAIYEIVLMLLLAALMWWMQRRRVLDGGSRPPSCSGTNATVPTDFLRAYDDTGWGSREHSS